MTEIFTTDYPLTNIAPGSLGFIECGQGGQLYVRSSSHDQFTLNIEGVGTLIGHAGLQVRDIQARKIEVRNNGVEPLDLVINIGSAEIIDRRASVSETLRVFDPVTGASFAEIIEMMQDADNQRVPVREIGSSFFAVNSVSTSAQTLIDPASNTDGVILRYMMYEATSQHNYGIFISETAPTAYNETGKHRLEGSLSGFNQLREVNCPIRLPAGFGLFRIAAQSANTHCQGGYDIL